MTLENSLDFKRRNLERLQDELAALELCGQIAFSDGDVIKYQRRLGRNVYDYVATRVANVSKWYVTGARENSSGLTDESFILEHLSKALPETIEMATCWATPWAVTDYRNGKREEPENGAGLLNDLLSVLFPENTDENNSH